VASRLIVLSAGRNVREKNNKKFVAWKICFWISLEENPIHVTRQAFHPERQPIHELAAWLSRLFFRGSRTRRLSGVCGHRFRTSREECVLIL
jgi:hypothetical protein